jgi:hypothetical protein
MLLVDSQFLEVERLPARRLRQPEDLAARCPHSFRTGPGDRPAG